MLDREQTGPKDITPRAVGVLKRILTNGFCPGTTQRNREKYESLCERLRRLPTLEEIGGTVDLESGHIDKGGMFSVVANEDRADIEDALIKSITMGRGEWYCHEYTLWSPQTLAYASAPLHIVRTTPEGQVNIIKVDEWSDKEKVVETIDARDIRRVSIGSGDYIVGAKGRVSDPYSLRAYPKVFVDPRLEGQEVLRVDIMGRPCSATITDVLIINSGNQLLARAVELSSIPSKAKKLLG